MSVPGWNDPPQFSHTALDSQGIRRSKLTKRPSPHSTPPPSHTPPITTSTLSPPPGPPLIPTSPPTPPTQHKEENFRADLDTDKCSAASSDVVGVSTSSGGVENYSGVIDGLESQLEKCKISMKEREVEEVEKRLATMRRQWSEGVIPTPVMTRMVSLVQALETEDTAEAQRIQVSLMVDHTSEVSHWMVGVKRLINKVESLIRES